MDKGRLQLPLQTVSLTAGFMTWVMLSPLLPFIKEDIALTASQTAWVTSFPVVLGSLLRIPIGYWTNRYGARLLFTISFLVLLLPIFYVGTADSFADLMLSGFFLGIGGAVFSVGVTSLPKYYPKEKHGLVNGIYGVGNIGTAITSFGAPVAAVALGWESASRLYTLLVILLAAAVFLLGDKRESRVVTPLVNQIKGVYRNPLLWIFCLFYFITFGAFVTFTVYLPNFLVSHFDMDKVDAGLRTAGFIALATAARPTGGWIADRWNPYVALMVVFSGLTLSGFMLSFSPTIERYTVGCLAIGLFAGLGNGIVFKLVPLYFGKQAGIVNGLVSAMGGLGGFFPPLTLTMFYNITGHYAIGFMALSEVALASLLLVCWLYFRDKLRLSENIIRSTVEGIMITDINGVIQSINPAFSSVTGYCSDEVIGKKPSLLKSGLQDSRFYEDMWRRLLAEGNWQGELWNKRKNGEIYLEWLTITAIRDEAGEVRHYAGMFSDVTNKKGNGL